MQIHSSSFWEVSLKSGECHVCRAAVDKTVDPSASLGLPAIEKWYQLSRDGAVKSSMIANVRRFTFS